MRGARPILLELHNTRFDKDLKKFTLVRGPSSPLFGILPAAASSTEEDLDVNQEPTQLKIALEAWEVGKGRLGRCFRGTLSCLSSPLPTKSKSDLEAPSLLNVPPTPRPTYPVVVKLVAPHARLIKWDGQRHAIYHSSQRKLEAAEILLHEISAEAEHYDETMRQLQGVVVPRFYGYGVSEDGKAACLVLEDCGVSLGHPYQRLSLDDRMMLFYHQVAIHQCGLYHGDFASRNFVKSVARPSRSSSSSPSNPQPPSSPSSPEQSLSSLSSLSAPLSLSNSSHRIKMIDFDRATPHPTCPLISDHPPPNEVFPWNHSPPTPSSDIDIPPLPHSSLLRNSNSDLSRPHLHSIITSLFPQPQSSSSSPHSPPSPPPHTPTFPFTIPSIIYAHTPNACPEIERLRIRLGLCEMGEMKMRDWEKFVPWGGDEWGSRACGGVGEGVNGNGNEGEKGDEDLKSKIR